MKFLKKNKKFKLLIANFAMGFLLNFILLLINKNTKIYFYFFINNFILLIYFQIK